MSSGTDTTRTRQRHGHDKSTQIRNGHNTDDTIFFSRPPAAETNSPTNELVVSGRYASTKCPNPGVALIWATPLPPLHFTPHEHLASHGRPHRCMISMPREMGSIARLARAQGRCNRFPVFKTRCGFVGARRPHWLLCRSSVACVRTGRLQRGSGPGGPRE